MGISYTLGRRWQNSPEIRSGIFGVPAAGCRYEFIGGLARDGRRLR
jgi:hypothetical protein